MAYSEEFKIPEVMCDKQGNLSMRNLVSLMGEVSMNHSYKMQAGLQMEKFRWIVYSWDVEVESPVKANDKILVTSMAIGMKKFYAYRNAFVKREGEIIAKAYGVFMLIDIDRMRPVKMSKELIACYEKDNPIYEKKDFQYKNDFKKSKEIMIRYTDIDWNLHVNNAVYFDYIYDLCKLDTKDIKFFNMVYKNEVRNKKSVLGEFVEVDGTIDFRLKSTENKTIYTYGKIIKNV